MTLTTQFDITELVAGQGSAEVTVNVALRILDWAGQAFILDRNLTAPPVSPAPVNGDAYMPAATATGDWAGDENTVQFYSDGWITLTPKEGWVLRVRDENIRIEYDGAAWVEISPAVSITPAATFTDQATNPAAPAAGKLKVFSKAIAGRSMLHARGSSGLLYPLQPSLFGSKFSYISSGNAAALATIGCTAVTTGASLTTPAHTQIYGWMSEATTAAGAGSDASVRTPFQYVRGDAVGSNGFFHWSRIAFPDASYTDGRMVAGMFDSAIATTGGANDPAIHAAMFQHVPVRDTNGNWRFMTKDGALGTQNLIDTGMPFAVASVFDCYVFCPPQGATIYWRIDNLTADTKQEGSTTANLPNATTPLCMGVGINNVTGVARKFRYQSLYTESDR